MEVVKVLLDRGADAEARDKVRRTPACARRGANDAHAHAPYRIRARNGRLKRRAVRARRIDVPYNTRAHVH